MGKFLDIRDISQLSDLAAKLDSEIRPSNAIPFPAREKFNEELLAIYDWLHQVVWSSVQDILRITDLERMNRNEICAHLRNFGLPFWVDATDKQLRDLLKNVVYINTRRNSIEGWKKYLRCHLGDEFTVSVRFTHNAPNFFTLSSPTLNFPSWDQIRSLQSDTSAGDCPRIFSDRSDLTSDVEVEILGPVLAYISKGIAQFFQDTAILFLTMIPTLIPTIDVRFKYLNSFNNTLISPNDLKD